MDLFDSDAQSLTQLPIEGGELYFLEKTDLGMSTQEVFQNLKVQTPWRTETISLWGKTFTQPRLIAWYGDAGKSYMYSGRKFAPLPWTSLLLDIKSKIETICNKQFNSVLINYYRNGSDSLGFHSDDEPELGEKPSIASLSLGETRTFTFKSKFDKSLKDIKINLLDGHLLLMEGAIQKNWQHGIIKEPKKTGERINLTFRYILD